MLQEEIGKMIMDAMKNGNHVKSEVYKSIKNEFLKAKTAKNAKPLDEAGEISIIQKLAKQHEESIIAYKAADRADLAESEQKELNVLNELLPKAPTESEIREYIISKYDTIDKKQMGLVIKDVKANLIGADGKLVSDIVRSFIR